MSTWTLSAFVGLVHFAIVAIWIQECHEPSKSSATFWGDLVFALYSPSLRCKRARFGSLPSLVFVEARLGAGILRRDLPAVAQFVYN